jgi:hypothetical protein
MKKLLFLICINLVCSNVIAKESFSFSTGATYITGDYGSSAQTEIYFVPFTFKYKYDKLNFKVTVPYLEKTGSKQVIQDIGQFGQRITSRTTTETGLGDISAAIRYNFYSNQKYQFLIDMEGKVNIGTASESKGLGTGKTDYSFRIGLYKVFNDITPYARLGFKVYGSPILNDVFYVSTGINYKIKPFISAGFDFAWREKVSDTGADKLQLTAFSSQNISKTWTIQEYIIKGFSRSTADWGGGVSVAYKFQF